MPIDKISFHELTIFTLHRANENFNSDIYLARDVVVFI